MRRVEEEAWSTDVALLLEATLYNPPTARESFADAGGGEHGARGGAAGVAAAEPAWIIGRFMLHWDVLRPDDRRARPALRTAHKPGPPAHKAGSPAPPFQQRVTWRGARAQGGGAAGRPAPRLLRAAAGCRAGGERVVPTAPPPALPALRAAAARAERDAG